MKRVFLLLAVLFLLTTSFSCNKSNPDKTTDTDIEIITLYVNSELGVYNDGESGLQLDAMMVREDEDAEWSIRTLNSIAGFEYCRGFEYELKVEKSHIENPAEGAASIEYKLVEVLSEEFKLGEGYVMSDDYIHYGPTSNDGEEHRETITKAEGEYYIAILKSKKTEALAFLADNGFTIMENSDEGTGEFYALRGKLKDCFQITVKGNSSVADVPGALYTSPLYNNDEWFKVDTFGRGNMILLGFSYRWDDEKIMRHIPYIEKYTEILNIYLIRKDLSEYGNYLLFGVTEESAGNAVEIHNWFSEVAGYHICDLDFPEFAATIDD